MIEMFPRACATAALIASAAMTLVLSCVSFQARAACLAIDDPQMQQYDEVIGKNPAEVERAVKQRIDSGRDTDPKRRAALHAVLAQALSVMERYDDVRETAQRGMALARDKTSSTYLNLLLLWEMNTFDEANVPSAIAELEAVRALQQPGSPADACMLIGLGQLEHQAGRVDQASVYLTRAYRMSEGAERRRQRALAADTLSIVMRDLRDFSQALSLNQDVIDWDVERGASFNLATSRFIRAAILREMGDHKGAIAELHASRQLSEQMHDEMGMAYDDLQMCLSNIELGGLQLARTQCTSALRFFEQAQSVEPEKQTLAGLAQIDLLEGKPAVALERLNRVLDHNGQDIVPRRLTHAYELRSRAYAGLGQHRRAFADLEQHVQRFKAATASDRTSEAAAIRARFETDREIERNTFLQRELEIQNERLAAQTERLQWMIVAAIAGVSVIALLTYLLLANKRKKQLLARLAQVDDLTDLPNRRRTFELASEAFDLARRQGMPLTIGILDLDHFKRVNDRYGHAVGDLVLQEFARLGRSTLRIQDVLGRWGGEEFLVVLPNTTLDVALAIIDRVRQAAGSIQGGALAEDLKISLSAGLATNEGNPAHLEEIIACADAALYDAKEGGRDLVCVAPESYSLASTGVRRVLKTSGVALTTGSFERRSSQVPTKDGRRTGS
jgi:diguanylate cyclase (GGDEF)-like protein